MTLLSVRTERPEPLGVTRIHRRPLEVRPWCPPCIRRRNCAKNGAGIVPGVERVGVPELVSAEDRHTLRRYARCTEKIVSKNLSKKIKNEKSLNTRIESTTGRG